MTGLDDERARGGNGCLIVALLGGIGLVVAGVAIETVDWNIDWTPDPAPVVPATPVNEPSVPSEAAPVEPEPMHPDGFGPTPEPLPILFSAEVVRANELEAGSICTLAVYLARGRNLIIERSVSLRCEGSVVYTALIDDSAFQEVPLGDGWYAYRASFGAGRGAADVESSERNLTIDDVGTFSIDDLSVPRRWAPFHDANAALVADVQHRLVQSAVPFEVDGEVPAAITEAMRGESSCELIGDAVPLDERVDCRLLLRCGSTTLYGAGTSGYIECDVRDGRMVTGSDAGESSADTDPRLHFDTVDDLLVLSDTDEVGSWSARFHLREPAGCTLEGSWRGAALDTEGRELTFVLDTSTSVPTLRWSGGAFDGAIETLQGTSDCESAELDLVTVATNGTMPASSYRMRFGSGMRTLAGSRVDGSLVLFAWRE